MAAAMTRAIVASSADEIDPETLGLLSLELPCSTAMATAMARAIVASSIAAALRFPISLLLSRCFSQAGSSLGPVRGLARRCSPLSTSRFTADVRLLASQSAIRLNQIRCRVNRSGDSGYSPLSSGSGYSDRPPTQMAPLFPGCGYEH